MGNWHEGTIGTSINKPDPGKIVHYWVKTCEEGDEAFGLEGGKIIKLQCKVNGETVINYDRGWDVEPDLDDVDIARAYAIILASYNY